MASTPTRPMTFAEFEQLPDPKCGKYELRRGELIEVPPPKWKHSAVQQRLLALLSQAAGPAGHVTLELGFRALPDGEYRIADVVYIPNERWASQDPEGHFRGAPDLVVEVLSPSNTASEMRDPKQVCLENGCIEFWIVDMDRRQIEVATRDGSSITYTAGQEIVPFFGGRVALDEIFAS